MHKRKKDERKLQKKKNKLMKGRQKEKELKSE